MGVLISLDSLQEGWYLDKPVRKDGVLLYSEGTLLTDAKIQNLQKILGDNYRVEVAFQSNNSQQTPEELMLLEYQQRLAEQDFDIVGSVSQEVKDDTIQTLRKVFISSHNSLNDTVKVVNKCINTITYQVNNGNFSYSLGQYKDEKTTKNVLEHSFRVAQFSICLANIYNQSLVGENKKRIDLESIGTAALLHDYGQRYTDPNEMKKLSVYQFSDEFLKTYPMIPKDLLQQPYNPKYNDVYAYVALKNAFSSSVCHMVLHSFESEKGTLFPPSISPNNVGSKIIYLCNLYDSLLANTISSDYPLENVSALMDQAAINNVINANLYQQFKDNIPLYSVGVRVQLSTGEYAKVIKSNLGNDISKPVVQTFVNPPSLPRTIDLRGERNITITKIISSHEKLSDKINNIANQQIDKIKMEDEISVIPEEQNENVPKAK